MTTKNKPKTDEATRKPDPEQLYLAGTEPPRNLDVEEAIETWRARVAMQRDAAASTKLSYEVVLARLETAGLEVYPFIDDKGDKKLVRADRSPKLKVSAAPKHPRRDDEDEQSAEERAEQRRVAREETEANRVEVRRVPREEVLAEIDPFAAVRTSMQATTGGDIAITITTDAE